MYYILIKKLIIMRRINFDSRQILSFLSHGFSNTYHWLCVKDTLYSVVCSLNPPEIVVDPRDIQIYVKCNSRYFYVKSIIL